MRFYSIARAMLHDEQDALDAVQEALVKVLTTRHVKDVVGYTITTVRNCAIDIIRHRQMFEPLPEEIPDHGSYISERLRRIGELRDELPEMLQLLVELHDENGYSLAELATITGMPVMTIRRRLDTAHMILKKRIENEI